MIILRKYSSSEVVLGSKLTGNYNGSNQIFTTEHSYASSNILITHNGQELFSGDDFIETGSSEITLLYLYPTNPKSLKATYIKG